MILELPALRSRAGSVEEVSRILAKYKKSAKQSAEKLHIIRIGGQITGAEPFEIRNSSLPETLLTKMLFQLENPV